MAVDTKTLKEQLEEILEKNKDAEKGYKKAADNTEHTQLKRYFEHKAEKRGIFNNNLQRQMVTAYEDFDDDSSFTGNMHRVWMDIKSFFAGDDDKAMLEEAIRGDKAAVEEYKELLKEHTLPMGIAEMIREQMHEIESDLSQNKNLEDLRS